ncbi:MAG: efflux RND transporter periplasmic adaptor subunit [Bacteroidota bacterium]
MKNIIYLLAPAMILASCGGSTTTTTNKTEEITKLQKQRADIDMKIKSLEGDRKQVNKATPVSVMEVQPTLFNSFIEVQSRITGDEVVIATAKAPGTVSRVLVQAGQSVRQGQVLATLDASLQDQQVRSLEPQIQFAKAVYEKQQKLWEQNIGTEVKLMEAKAAYESLLKQRSVSQAGRNLYNIVSPINGTVDAVNIKIGDQSSAGGIVIVNTTKLKAEASLGENYLGKVKQGDPTTLILADMNDSLTAKISYVAKTIDPTSRTFAVQVRLGNNAKLHPNMSCIMKIANYTSQSAMVIPISVVQKTAEGNMVYVVDGTVAKLVPVVLGHTSNGLSEVLSGLAAGDKVVIAGYQDLDAGETVVVQ